VYCATHCWIKDFGRYKQGKYSAIQYQRRKTLPKNYYLRQLFKNCALPVKERKREIKKQEACLFLEVKSISFDVRMSGVELKQSVRVYIVENEKAEIICLAKLGRHKILFTYSYYSNL
jgi:hypothetical protein